MIRDFARRASAIETQIGDLKGNYLLASEADVVDHLNAAIASLKRAAEANTALILRRNKTLDDQCRDFHGN